MWLAKTGHWAEYDDLSVEQFVQGYLDIVQPTIPIGPSTEVTRDHIGYLQNMMRDTFSSPWHLVRSTHKHILLMVKHKQLKREDTATSNSIRAEQLLLAQEESMQAKFLGIPDKPQAKAGKKKQPGEGGSRQAMPCLPDKLLFAPEDPRCRRNQHVALLPVLLQSWELPFLSSTDHLQQAGRQGMNSPSTKRQGIS